MNYSDGTNSKNTFLLFLCAKRTLALLLFSFGDISILILPLFFFGDMSFLATPRFSFGNLRRDYDHVVTIIMWLFSITHARDFQLLRQSIKLAKWGKYALFAKNTGFLAVHASLLLFLVDKSNIFNRFLFSPVHNCAAKIEIYNHED